MTAHAAAAPSAERYLCPRNVHAHPICRRLRIDSLSAHDRE